MDRVLDGLHWKTLLVYLDDIIVYGRDFEQEIERLTQVFERLIDANMKLKPKKCQLFKKEVAYLGHIVSERGIANDPDKVKMIKEWPVPKTY